MIHAYEMRKITESAIATFNTERSNAIHICATRVMDTLENVARENAADRANHASVVLDDFIEEANNFNPLFNIGVDDFEEILMGKLSDLGYEVSVRRSPWMNVLDIIW